MRGTSLIRNTLLLTLTSLLLRLTGVAFNAFLTRRMGTVGLGVLQLVMTSYAFGITLATSGIRLGATRLVVEAGSDADRQRRALRFCLRWGLAMGLVVAVGLFCLAGPLCRRVLGCPEATTALRLLALGIPFVSMSSALGGYYTATGRIARQAAVQLLEQGVQIGVTLALLSRWQGRGLSGACAAVALGGCLSEAASFVAYRLLCRLGSSAARRGEPPLTRRFLRIALPDASGALVGSALRTAQGLLIPVMLRRGGADGDAALAAYGVIGGMVMPLLLCPSALLTSCSTLLLPRVADAHARGYRLRAASLSSRALRLSALFSVGAAGFFLGFAGLLSQWLFPGSDIANLLRLFAPLLPLMYLDIVVDGLLKGLDQQLWSMGVNILDASLGVVLVCLLIPRLGVAGYVLSIFVTRVLNATLSLLRLVRVSRFPYDLWQGLLLPLFSAAAALLALHQGARLTGQSVAAAPLLALLLYAVIYLLPQLGSLWSALSAHETPAFCPHWWTKGREPSCKSNSGPAASAAAAAPGCCRKPLR